MIHADRKQLKTHGPIYHGFIRFEVLVGFDSDAMSLRLWTAVINKAVFSASTCKLSIVL